MGHARPRPKHLAAKLLQIRECLGLSQSQLARLLNVGINASRVCEYEKGTREPGLLTLLAYAYLVGLTMDHLVDDNVDLPVQIKINRGRKSLSLH
jgi:transcriptional regulator with XRE-family HTH domain